MKHPEETKFETTPVAVSDPLEAQRLTPATTKGT
jgi:hypothetical protein